MTNRDKYLTLTEVAAELGVSERTIRRRIDKGEMGAEKVNGKLMVVVGSIAQLTERDTHTSRDKTALIKELQQSVSILRRQVAALEEQLEDRSAQLREKDEDLRRKDEQIAEASHRHDTVVMQMTRLLEYHQQPFWRKLFGRKALPPPVVDEPIIDAKSKKRTEENEPPD